MKRVFLILTMPLISFSLYAQDLPKQKEVGLTFSGLNNFGVTFRTGNAHSLWRFSTLFLYGSKESLEADSSETKSENGGFALKIGKEFRKPITQNLSFRFGADVSFEYFKYLNDVDDRSISNNDNTRKKITYGPGINLILGLNYTLGKSIILGAELLPFVHYTIGTNTDKSLYFGEAKSDISGFSYGLSNTSALLSLAYQF